MQNNTNHMDVSENRGSLLTLQIIPFLMRGFPLFSPSILGFSLYFWKHPHGVFLFVVGVWVGWGC